MFVIDMNTKEKILLRASLIVGWPGTQFGDSNMTSNITDFQRRI